MSNTSRETQTNPRSGERSRSGRMVTLVVLLLSVVGIGAVVFWANYDQLNAPSRTATAQPAAQPQAPSPPRVEASDDTMQSLNALQQSVKALQASQQHTADQLELIQKQLASEQGERKLLSEQVGALSGRVDGLSTSATSVTTGTTSQSPKKKPASR
jgi:TolA-binding protein